MTYCHIKSHHTVRDNFFQIKKGQNVSCKQLNTEDEINTQRQVQKVTYGYWRNGDVIYIIRNSCSGLVYIYGFI